MYLKIRYPVILRHTNYKILLNSGCIIFKYFSEDLSQSLSKNCAIQFIYVYDKLKCDNTRGPEDTEILCQT